MDPGFYLPHQGKLSVSDPLLKKEEKNIIRYLKQKISEQSSVFHQSVAKKKENDNNVWNNIEKL